MVIPKCLITGRDNRQAKRGAVSYRALISCHAKMKPTYSFTTHGDMELKCIVFKFSPCSAWGFWKAIFLPLQVC